MQVTAEAVEPITVAGKEKTDGGDGDNGSPSYSYSSLNPNSGDSEDVVAEDVVDGLKGDVKIAEGLQLYKLTDADKDRFTDMVSRHASRA